MMIMEINTYNRREDDLATAKRLLVAEQTRLLGIDGYSIDDFEKNMKKAIYSGAENDAK